MSNSKSNRNYCYKRKSSARVNCAARPLARIQPIRRTLLDIEITENSRTSRNSGFRRSVPNQARNPSLRRPVGSANVPFI